MGRAPYDRGTAGGPARGPIARLGASMRRAPVWAVQRYGRDTVGAETPLPTRGEEWMMRQACLFGEHRAIPSGELGDEA